MGTYSAEGFLRVCSSQDYTSIKEQLVECPSLVNCVDTRLQLTPLSRAVISEDSGLIDILLAHGANPNVPNSIGETPLHQAADSSQLELAKSLLMHGANVNALSNIGESPLLSAAYRGDHEVLELLLLHGADPNIQSGATGRTALHLTIEAKQLRSSSVLIQHKANLLLEDLNQKTPLDLAQELGLWSLMSGFPGKLTVCSELETIVEARMTEEEALSSYRKPNRQLHPRKTLLDEPDAELHLMPSGSVDLAEFLAGCGCEELSSKFIAKYRDLEGLQSAGVTTEELQELGVKGLGNCVKMVLRLDHMAGVLGRAEVSYPFRMRSEGNSLCCGQLKRVTGIGEWLQLIGLRQLKGAFVQQGYDLGTLFASMHSRCPVTSGVLKVIGIQRPEDRESILSRLSYDCNLYIGRDLVPEKIEMCGCMLL